MAAKRKARPRYKSGPKKGKFMSNRAIAAQKRSRKAPKKKSSSRSKRKTAPTTRRKTTTMARRKKRKSTRRRKRSGISTGEVKDLMIGGAIYGFITEPDAEDSELRTTVQTTLNKIPEVGNRDISNGLALWAIDKYVYGNKHVRNTAKAALTVGAVRFGRRGFKLGGGGTDELGGWDDAVDVTAEGAEISGIIE